MIQEELKEAILASSEPITDDDSTWPIPNNKIRKQYYHITPTDNVNKILTQGLAPHTPTDFSDSTGVYLFLSVEDASTALMNWFGDREVWGVEGDPGFIKNFTLLGVDPEGIEEIDEENAAGYEIIVLNHIKKEHISIVQKNF